MTEEENIRLDSTSLESGSKKGLGQCRKTLKDDFGTYEKTLTVLLQAGYVPVASAMLITAFMEPSPEMCDAMQQTNNAWSINENHDFYSISVQQGHACHKDPNLVNYFMSSSLMWGAFFGSFLCGYLSDKFGRKPVCIGCLFMITFCHFLFTTSQSLNWHVIHGLMVVMGFFCGGYMVTNFVLLTEAFELARSRLLVVSFNGWSISMAVTGLIAMTTGNYFHYHFFCGLIGLGLSVLLVLFTNESCRWLSAQGMHQQAKKIAIKTSLYNNERKYSQDDVEEMEWFDVLGFSAPTHAPEKKTWKTLYKSFLKPTTVMFYSFLASSIVSFGFYFSIDILPGNRYVNMAFMGGMKFLFGFVPFVLNRVITKRTIAIASIALCCIASVMIVSIQYFDSPSLRVMISVLSMVISAGIDPTWKINHLYSAELFPTSVRSMARGICNAGGRLGSVLAPMIVYFRAINLLLPNTIFTVLLLIQLIVIVICLPDDSDKDANEMNDE